MIIEKNMNDKEEDFYCDYCSDDTVNTLYEGWFYTSAKYNVFAQGTASAGLLQRRRVCYKCLNGPLKDYTYKGKKTNDI